MRSATAIDFLSVLDNMFEDSEGEPQKGDEPLFLDGVAQRRLDAIAFIERRRRNLDYSPRP